MNNRDTKGGWFARYGKIALAIAILCFCSGLVTAIPQQDYTIYGTATLIGTVLTAQDDAVISLAVDGIELVSYTMGDISGTNNYVLKVPLDSDPGVTTAAQEGDSAYIYINGVAINEGPQIIEAPGTTAHVDISATRKPPTVTVVYPNGGESIPIGTQVKVSAHATDDNAVTGVTFYYSCDGGSNWDFIGEGVKVTGTDKEGIWNRTWDTRGLSTGTNYLIKTVVNEDRSDGMFSLNGIDPKISLKEMSQDCVVSLDSGNATNATILTDISNGTDETVSAPDCQVYIEVEDHSCNGYSVYVDGVYILTEGAGGNLDGFCAFYVSSGTHKFELRTGNYTTSKSWYCECGKVYSWISMPDYWCGHIPGGNLNAYRDISVTPDPISSVKMNVYTGWNLISLPKIPVASDVLAVMRMVGDNLISVWTYEDGKWKRYDLTGPSFLNDLATMEPGKGYWIEMKSPDCLDVLYVKGSELTNKSIPLASGWNLVGYNSLCCTSITNVMNSVAGNWNSVWTYEDGRWKRYDLSGEVFLNDLETMEPGKGYWIDMKSNDSLTLGA
ncbi:hypothetical protein C5S53_07200 [Methanophagales archaeon]|nr:hypothetical protein C5S53_07200 [Methanophagales archaeon]